MKSTQLNKVDDLTFLSNYHKHCDIVASNIKNALSVKVMPDIKSVYNGNLLKIIKYSDLGDRRDVSRFFTMQSESLIALANKISHMIHTGKADSIERMIISICSDHKKKLTQPNHGDGRCNGKMRGGYLGNGHFRWNYRAYTLTHNEISIVKDYFKIK